MKGSDVLLNIQMYTNANDNSKFYRNIISLLISWCFSLGLCYELWIYLNKFCLPEWTINRFLMTMNWIFTFPHFTKSENVIFISLRVSLGLINIHISLLLAILCDIQRSSDNGWLYKSTSWLKDEVLYKYKIVVDDDFMITQLRVISKKISLRNFTFPNREKSM